MTVDDYFNMNEQNRADFVHSTKELNQRSDVEIRLAIYLQMAEHDKGVLRPIGYEIEKKVEKVFQYIKTGKLKDSEPEWKPSESPFAYPDDQN